MTDRPQGVSRAARKIVSLDELLAKRKQCRAMGLKLVQCHGCFDIVHPGHIRHLRQARAQGDLLLVTITGDQTFAKRNGRPLIPEHLRAENLAELDCVDLVLIDRSETAVDLLAEVQPDVFVKGKEYETNNDPRFALERQTVEAAGGRVVFTAGDVVFSSTALIGALERSLDPGSSAFSGIGDTLGQAGAFGPFHLRMTQLAADPRLAPATLRSVVDRFRNKRIVVVGEVIQDSYIHCDNAEVASESPVMTLRPIQRTEYDGGAAVIARHLRGLGAEVTLVTGLPQTPAGLAMRSRLTAEGITVRAIDIHGQLADKQRYLVGIQKVMKLNALSPIVLDATGQDNLLTLATEACGSITNPADAAIIADFGNGLLSGTLVRRLCTALRPRAKILVGDISGRRGNLNLFHDMDLLTPGEQEARDALRCYDAGLTALAWNLLNTTSSRAAIMKLGPEGAVACSLSADARTSALHPARAAKLASLTTPLDTHLASSLPTPRPQSSAIPTQSTATNSIKASPFGTIPGGTATNDDAIDAAETPSAIDGQFISRITAEHVPSMAGPALDALGCGDAMLAVATLTLTTGAGILEATMLGSLAAAIHGQRLGNPALASADVLAALARVTAPRLTLTPADPLQTLQNQPTRPKHVSSFGNLAV